MARYDDTPMTMRPTGALRILSFALPLMAFACGGPQDSGAYLLGNLKDAMERPVETEERSLRHSRLVQDVAEADLLANKTRLEVQEAIGRGEPCSRHPQCQERGFDPNDWFYQVGREGPAKIPLLIVGFDHTGHVNRTWYLKTH
jgi:hypothetical protein